MKLERMVWDTISQYKMLPDGATVICGLSGGPDSVALCRILKSIQPRLHLKLLIAHVNHGIRGKSADADEAFAHMLAQSLDLAFYCINVNVPALAHQQQIGLEACARKVRYDFFVLLAQSTGAEYIATAHHAEDALETVLLHLARGSGIRGLSGIQPVRRIGDLMLVRPLIFASKEQIYEYLCEVGADYRIDASNNDDDYARNRIRHHVIPALQQINPALIQTSIQTLKNLRTEAEFLEEQAQQAYCQVIDDQSIDISALLALHPALQGRILEKVYNKVAGIQAPQLCASHMESVLALCKGSRSSGSINLPASVSARREYGRLFIERTQTILPDIVQIPLVLGKLIEFDGWKIELSRVQISVTELKSIHKFYVDCSKIYGKLLVRPRLSGDKIRLPGRSFDTSLKKLMIDRKIPKLARQTWPVIVDAHGIVAVAQVGVDARVAADANSREFYLIEIKKH